MKPFIGIAVLGVVLGATASGQTREMAEHEFVARMLQHHQDGIEMALVAEQNATTAEVRALARRVRERQERDTRALKPFVPSNPPLPRGTTGQQTQTEHGLDHYTNLHESRNGLERLRAAAGTNVDLAYLTEMARHHQRALQMTQGMRFDTPRLKRVADRMAASQKKEMAELQRALQRVP